MNTTEETGASGLRALIDLTIAEVEDNLSDLRQTALGNPSEDPDARAVIDGWVEESSRAIHHLRGLRESLGRLDDLGRRARSLLEAGR